MPAVRSIKKSLKRFRGIALVDHVDNLVDKAIQPKGRAQMTRRLNELEQLRRALFAKLLWFHLLIHSNA